MSRSTQLASLLACIALLLASCGTSKTTQVTLPKVQGNNAYNRYIEQYAFSRFADKNTVVRIAELGNDAGVIGAAFLKDAFHCR